ncbi:MAG: Cof-type HAD-IIB family hydrolase [Eubacterium sp.]
MNLKNKIKLIGVDLDGTLLRDDKSLCDGAEEIIRAAAGRGIYIVPITGRPFSGIPECIRDIKEIKYIISSNGAQIINAESEKSIFSFPLSNKKSNEIIDILGRTDCMFEAFADNVGYIEQNVYDYYVKTYKGTPVGEYIFSSRRVTESISALFKGTDRTADEIFAICKSEQVRTELVTVLDRIDDIQYCRLGDRFIEVTKKGTDKGEALEALCGYLGLSLSQTMAFGDGENDLQFLKKAGIAVAMANAFDGVKAHADIIAKSNNDNGVCEIIGKL